MASLMHVVLLVVPLVSVVYGTLHFSNSRPFIELLLAQPVGRTVLYGGLYLGLVLPLSALLLTGVALPALWHGAFREAGAPLAATLLCGVLLTCVFASLAFLCGVRFEDRARGLGVALLAWFAAAVAWDGLILLAVTALSDYPLEAPLLVLILANPVDLGRIGMLMTLDAAALMGYTGAAFTRFFGSTAGIVTATAALGLWIVVPAAIGLYGFRSKDF
jgi:Cu-processing system permease protein